MAGIDWLVFGSFVGRLAQAGLCSVVLQDSWPRLACVRLYCRSTSLSWLVFSSIVGRLACARYCCKMAGLGYLVFSSIALA